MIKPDSFSTFISLYIFGLKYSFYTNFKFFKDFIKKKKKKKWLINICLDVSFNKLTFY